MNCSEARHEMALHAGHDPCEQHTWDEVRLHAATCPECRNHYRKLKSVLALIENSEPEQSFYTQDSLWPRLERELDRPRPAGLKRALRVWLPVAVTSVACLLVVGFWIAPPADAVPAGSSPTILRQMSPGWFDWSFSSAPGMSREAREANGLITPPEQPSALKMSREAREANERALRARQMEQEQQLPSVAP